MTALFGAEERIPSKFLADPAAAIPTLRRDWLAYHETGRVGESIRPVIAISWTRSRDRHVSPERRAADVDLAALRGFESHDLARRLYLQSTRAVVDQLSSELSGSDSAVVVCDEFGRILARAGDRSILRRTEAQNFVPDAVWNEECAGTNGIGLALTLGRAAQVFAGEHFCVGFQNYACTAAPIRHPVTREVLGVLDVTTDARAANFHTYAMVVHAARDVEQQMEEHVFGRERELLERYLRGRVGRRAPLLTVDRSGRTIIQNAPAAQSLTNEDLPCVLRVVQEALRGGRDLTHRTELSLGAAEVAVHVVRSEGEVIGALVAVEQPGRRRRSSASAKADAFWHPLVGRSPAMLELFRRAGRVAERCIPVVIDGEPGTGKLSLALALHARSPRADRPLALVTCTARGWRREWHGALAGDGTVVLRRLGTLADGHQLELAAELDAMAGDEGPWPIGILTAGDRQPRPELLHRLAQARLTLPPLRDRGADVTLIATDWCRRQERDEPPGPSLGPAAQEALAAHDWPGNVRELLSVLAAARINQRGTHITPHDLGLPGAGPSRRGVGSTIELRAVERDAIERALEQTGGNISHAADVLGTSRSTLYRRLRTYRIVG